MKVLITYPPIISDKGVPLLSQNRQFQFFKNPSFIYPLVSASAATFLKAKGYEVLYKDFIVEKSTYEEFKDYIIQNKPDIIAIETKTPVIKIHWKIIDELKATAESYKDWNLKVVLLGDHVTAFPQESLEESKVDFVLTGGDYDFMLVALCEFLESKGKLKKGFWYREKGSIKNSGDFCLDDDLNELPIIDRELTNSFLYNVEHNIKVRPFAYTMAGRDCPYHQCKFCSWTTLFPKFRTRKPESLLDEIGMLIENYGVKEVFDDTGTLPQGEWLTKFCNGLIERGYNKKITFSCNMRVDYINPKTAKLMKEANFRLLKVGLESANQKTLDLLSKGIMVEQITNACKCAKEAGLSIHLTVMVGFPWETRSEVDNTLNLAKKLMECGYAELLQSTIVVPYPGTPLYKEAVKNDWFNFDPTNYERFDMSEPVLTTPDMSPQEVMDMCRRVYKTFLSSGYIFNKIKLIRSYEDIKYNLKGVKALFGHLFDFSGRKNKRY